MCCICNAFSYTCNCFSRTRNFVNQRQYCFWSTVELVEQTITNLLSEALSDFIRIPNLIELLVVFIKSINLSFNSIDFCFSKFTASLIRNWTTLTELGLIKLWSHSTLNTVIDEVCAILPIEWVVAFDFSFFRIVITLHCVTNHIHDLNTEFKTVNITFSFRCIIILYDIHVGNETTLWIWQTEWFCFFFGVLTTCVQLMVVVTNWAGNSKLFKTCTTKEFTRFVFVHVSTIFNKRLEFIWVRRKETHDNFCFSILKERLESIFNLIVLLFRVVTNFCCVLNCCKI